jgi:hypothetical protein
LIPTAFSALAAALPKVVCTLDCIICDKALDTCMEPTQFGEDKAVFVGKDDGDDVLGP